MKLLLLFSILAMGLSIAMAKNYTWGTSGPDDTLLDKRTVYKDYSVFGFVREVLRFPTYPKNYDVPITAIKVVDKINNGVNRMVQLTNGGVGSKFLEIVFFAPIYRTFDYDVYIYGKKK